MAVDTISKEAAQALQYFENKLAFEYGPYGLNEALKAKERIQIIDLRTPEFYAKGHVPGAINVDLQDLDKHLSKLNKDATIVTYCYNQFCHLSTKAAIELSRKGYRVKELYGGWDGWVKYELPVEGKAHESSCSSTKSSCGG